MGAQIETVVKDGVHQECRPYSNRHLRHFHPTYHCWYVLNFHCAHHFTDASRHHLRAPRPVPILVASGLSSLHVHRCRWRLPNHFQPLSFPCLPIKQLDVEMHEVHLLQLQFSYYVRFDFLIRNLIPI